MARTITLPASATQTVTGTLTIAGSATNAISLVSSAPGTSTTLSCDPVAVHRISAGSVTKSADVLLNVPLEYGVSMADSLLGMGDSVAPTTIRSESDVLLTFDEQLDLTLVLHRVTDTLLTVTDAVRASEVARQLVDSLLLPSDGLTAQTLRQLADELVDFDEILAAFAVRDRPLGDTLLTVADALSRQIRRALADLLLDLDDDLVYELQQSLLPQLQATLLTGANTVGPPP